MRLHIGQHFRFSFILVILAGLIAGCSSVRLITCGDKTCDLGEEKTCMDDCKKEPVKPILIHETLSEGQSITYSSDGNQFDINVLVVGYSNNQTGTKLSINGRLTPLLKIGDSYRMDNGIKVGVKDIIVNKAGAANDLVQFIVNDKIQDFLEEGSYKEYNISEEHYYVSPLIITDTLNADAIAKFVVNGKPSKSLKINQTQSLDGLKIEINSIIPNQANDPVEDLVEFTLNGNVHDIMKEGGTRSYLINGKEYEIQVIGIGDVGNSGSSVRLIVDGNTTCNAYIWGSCLLKDGTVLKIEDILPNELGENRGNLVEISLDGKVSGIIDDRYGTKNFNIDRRDYKIIVVSVNKGSEKRLPENQPFVSFVVNGILLDRLYTNQDILLNNSCSLMVKDIYALKEGETGKDNVDFSFSCP